MTFSILECTKLCGCLWGSLRGTAVPAMSSQSRLSNIDWFYSISEESMFAVGPLEGGGVASLAQDHGSDRAC